MDHEDGFCSGGVVHLTDDAHPTLLGPDGEPLRYTRRSQAGFDLRPQGAKVKTRG